MTRGPQQGNSPPMRFRNLGKNFKAFKEISNTLLKISKRFHMRPIRNFKFVVNPSTIALRCISEVGTIILTDCHIFILLCYVYIVAACFVALEFGMLYVVHARCACCVFLHVWCHCRHCCHCHIYHASLWLRAYAI